LTVAGCTAWLRRSRTPGRERRLDRQIEAADYLFNAGDAAGAGPIRARARVGRIRTYDENRAAIGMLELALEDAHQS